MKRGSTVCIACLTLVTALGLAPGCSGDNHKATAPTADAGAAGEGAGEAGGGGTTNSAGTSGSRSLAGEGGTSDLGGTAGDAGLGGAGASAGDQPSAGAPTAGGASGAGGTSGSGGTSSGTAGSGGARGNSGGVAGNAGGGGATPLSTACLNCTIEACIPERSACLANATCSACRTVNYSASACANNAQYVAWAACVCQSFCATSCTEICP